MGHAIRPSSRQHRRPDPQRRRVRGRSPIAGDANQADDATSTRRDLRNRARFHEREGAQLVVAVDSNRRQKVPSRRQRHVEGDVEEASRRGDRRGISRAQG